jgi:glycine/D-amino acid oxidase-like deaminating enzyme
MWTAPELHTLHAGAAHIGSRLPGTVELLSADELAPLGWAGLDEVAGAIRERQAGHLDPDALRTAVLDDLAGRANVDLRTGHEAHRADITVVAAGAWTPRVLASMGLSAPELRIRSVQYSVYGAAGWQPPAFVDATTGLFGRPTDSGLLLGLPTEDWDVDPDSLTADPSLGARAAHYAIQRFPQLGLGPVRHRVRAAECYARPGLLSLRPAGANTYTFSGGSGGAVKSALAASRSAAADLLRSRVVTGTAVTSDYDTVAVGRG